jgi:hypothetical protein
LIADFILLPVKFVKIYSRSRVAGPHGFCRRQQQSSNIHLAEFIAKVISARPPAIFKVKALEDLPIYNPLFGCGAGISWLILISTRIRAAASNGSQGVGQIVKYLAWGW